MDFAASIATFIKCPALLEVNGYSEDPEILACRGEAGHGGMHSWSNLPAKTIGALYVEIYWRDKNER